MREYLKPTELLAARDAGERLEARPGADYAGEAVEHLPRKDPANNHPDCYPWHVIGRPDYARLRSSQIIAIPAA